jgi:glutaredoxin
MAASVVFYTRRRCCLCDEALAVVTGVQRAHPFSLEVVDIDGDDALRERYDEKVPVIVVDGRLHAKYRVDAQRFERRLRSAEAA